MLGSFEDVGYLDEDVQFCKDLPGGEAIPGLKRNEQAASEGQLECGVWLLGWIAWCAADLALVISCYVSWRQV